MISRGRLLFVSVSLTTVLMVAAGSMLAATSGREPDDGKDSLYKYLSVFTEVLGLVKRAYVDETETEKLMSGAFEGAIDALDPFSLYIPAAELDDYLASRAIGSARSGLIVLKERGVAYVVAVTPGSPGDKAGLETADMLSTLNGEPTRNLPLFKIHEMLAGAPGNKIEIERIRLGQSETITLELADYSLPGVTLETRRGVPVLRLPGFYDATPKDIATSLENLAKDIASLPDLSERDKLIVDLRGAAGGVEATAYEAANLFVKGELGVLALRDKPLEIFNGQREPLWAGDQMVVLIDRGTQGAAEILAAILSQAAGAKLIGERSFGYSGRQRLVALSNGDRLQITDAFYTGPDRSPLNESLDPDVLVRPEPFAEDDEESASDPALERGLEVLLEESEEVVEKKAA